MLHESPRWTVPVAAAAIAALAAMVAITAATGVSQETFEIDRVPDVYAADLRDHALALRALFALDSAFLVLYTALVVGVATALATPATPTLLGVAIAPFADGELELADPARARVVARGEHFLSAGDRAVDCGTLLAGVVREDYPLADGRESRVASPEPATVSARSATCCPASRRGRR